MSPSFDPLDPATWDLLQETSDKYYDSQKLRPIIKASSKLQEMGLLERIEERFAPAQTQPPLRYPEGVVHLAWMPDSARIVGGCGDNAVCIWKIKDWRKLAVQMAGDVDFWVEGVGVSQDGSKIAFVSSGTVGIWDGNKNAQSFHTDSSVPSFAISPDGAYVVWGSTTGRIFVRDLASGATVVGRIPRVPGGRGDEYVHVHAVAYSPDGSRIVSGDTLVRMWDATTGEMLWKQRVPSTGVRSVAYSPDGTRIVAGSWGQAVVVLDAQTGDRAIEHELKGHTATVVSVAFSPDSSRIVSGSQDGTIRLWDADSGDELDVLRGHRGPINVVAFSPNGKYVASSSQDQTLRIWDATGSWKLSE